MTTKSFLITKITRKPREKHANYIIKVGAPVPTPACPVRYPKTAILAQLGSLACVFRSTEIAVYFCSNRYNENTSSPYSASPTPSFLRGPDFWGSPVK